MRFKALSLLVLAVASLFHVSAFSQSIIPDTSFVAAAVESATQRYTIAIGDNSLLYTGPEYLDYNKSYVEGNQFFGTGKLQLGVVHYQGAVYSQAPLLYDIRDDKLVIHPPSTPLQFKLVDEHVKYFVIDGHTFVRLVQNDSTRYSVPTGYYELVVDGTAKVVVKRTKKTQIRRGLYGLEGDYKEEAKVYLQKDGQFHSAKSKGSVVSLLSDKKAELDAYAREHKLKFKKGGQEAAITELVGYYNSLQKPSTQPN